MLPHIAAAVTCKFVPRIGSVDEEAAKRALESDESVRFNSRRGGQDPCEAGVCGAQFATPVVGGG